MTERPLDLGWMRIFTEVARRGSLTAAAASLRLTQPAVSYQIRRLEDDLGVALVRRKHRGIELTAEGLKLFEIVSRNVDAIDLLAQQLRRTEGTADNPPAHGLCLLLSLAHPTHAWFSRAQS
ncbi:DNA-binding transcriptional LysR family regulator [Agrobacterium sp. SORGH_AS 745]|nr:DNA-binding transcriptional LysR family regulator [Agrobacterium sp. SORGH_AS_0745]